jgi:tetratricopeptide (TPR) repeat protein
MKPQPIASDEFLAVALPALQRRDPEHLADQVNQRWDARQLCQLLYEGTPDARKVVCLTLGLVGDMQCVSCLAGALHDPDEQMHAMAEHALWSVWFRAGGDQAIGRFRCGLEAMEANELPCALEQFHRAVELDPNFAEAFNQCAIAHYLLEQWSQTIEDCQEAVQRVPVHFGAHAGMGHAYAQLGDLEQAAACYERALAINPRMPTIQQALQRIRERPS